MQTIDPDVLKAVQTIFEARRNSHVGKVKVRQREAEKAQFETQIELLFDEVSKVVDPKHPAFLLVLALAVESKISKRFEEPEYRSCLEFPEAL